MSRRVFFRDNEAQGFSTYGLLLDTLFRQLKTVGVAGYFPYEYQEDMRCGYAELVSFFGEEFGRLAEQEGDTSNLSILSKHVSLRGMLLEKYRKDNERYLAARNSLSIKSLKKAEEVNEPSWDKLYASAEAEDARGEEGIKDSYEGKPDSAVVNSFLAAINGAHAVDDSSAPAYVEDDEEPVGGYFSDEDEEYSSELPEDDDEYDEDSSELPDDDEEGYSSELSEDDDEYDEDSSELPEDDDEYDEDSSELPDDDEEGYSSELPEDDEDGKDGLSEFPDNDDDEGYSSELLEDDEGDPSELPEDDDEDSSELPEDDDEEDSSELPADDDDEYDEEDSSELPDDEYDEEDSSELPEDDDDDYDEEDSSELPEDDDDDYDDEDSSELPDDEDSSELPAGYSSNLPAGRAVPKPRVYAAPVVSNMVVRPSYARGIPGRETQEAVLDMMDRLANNIKGWFSRL